MKTDPNLFSMQINVPHSEYGAHTYFIAPELRAWIKEYGLDNQYCGGGSWGNGFTNGITNHESVYMVRNIRETDAIAFKLQFPKCKVYINQQYRDEV